MKKLLLLLFIVIGNLTRAQGPQTMITVPVTSGPTAGGTVQGWLYLPADYATSSTKYPVVVFCHGFGENGAAVGINGLLNNGIPNLIAHGMRPDNITDPITKAKFSFIEVATQSYDWSPSPDEILSTLKWLITNYRVNTNRIYINGLSAGGQQTVEAITTSPELSHYFAAACPMSPAPYYNPSDIQLGYAATENIHTWFMDGDNDPPYTANTNWLISRFNAFLPKSSYSFFWSGGHCCWTTYENITWHNPSVGDSTSGLSMWEWFLKFQKPIVGLPVTLTNFAAISYDTYTKLTWTTQTESNNSYFVVERSEDGLNFTEAARINSQAPSGNSTAPINYQVNLTH